MAGWLVVNADDLGVSDSATSGIEKAHREGLVTSASLAVTTPGYRNAVETCIKRCPDLGIGLHFTLTSGGPAADARRVPLLVGPDGLFHWRFLTLFAAVAARRVTGLVEQIRIELEAQLERLKQDGIRPDHLNGERHVHLIPGIFELVLEAARAHDIPYVRAGRDYGRRLFRASDALEVSRNGGVVKSCLLSALSARARARLGEGVRSADFLASYLYSGSPRVIGRVLEAPPDGVVEVMVHPGLPEAGGRLDLGNRELERYLSSSERRRELDACLLSRGATRSWRLTTFRELARAGASR